MLENCWVCGSDRLHESDGSSVCDACGAHNPNHFREGRSVALSALARFRAPIPGPRSSDHPEYAVAALPDGHDSEPGVPASEHGRRRMRRLTRAARRL